MNMLYLLAWKEATTEKLIKTKLYMHNTKGNVALTNTFNNRETNYFKDIE